MKRSELDSTLGRPLIYTQKFGVAAAALAMFLPLQAAAQLGPGPWTCGSDLTMDAQGQEPFFVNERIPIILTLEAQTVNDGNADGLLNINTFDYKSDCAAGTDFNTCVPAGNTVVIATADGDIGGTCGASFTTAPVDATTVRFTPASPIELRPTETCTVEFEIMVTAAVSDTATIIETSGWAESQVACYTDDAFRDPYPDPARSSASAQVSFSLSPVGVGFRVTKYFADQSATATADVHFECNGGLPLRQDYTLGHGETVTFSLLHFPVGEVDCRVWEDPVPGGYAPDYTAGSLGGVAGSIDDDDTGCHYTDIETGAFSCEIDNDLEEVAITVYKSWASDLEDQPIELVADALYTCFDVYTSPDGSGGAVDVNGSLSFAGVYDSDVIDGIYPASQDSYCTVTEVNLEDWIEADDSDCDRVPVVSGAECTIYNAAFFEGIPTLNHYGMAFLALLMLGAGAVAFRRLS